MVSSRNIIRAISIVLAVAGFVLPWWQLSLLGAFLAAAAGQWVTALILAAVLDGIWGTPMGWGSFVPFPAMLTTILVILTRTFSLRFVRSKMPENI